MSNLETNEQNVVSLFGFSKEKTEKKNVTEDEAQAIFNDAIRKNEENRKRLMKSRLQANKSVMKSHNLKK